MDEGFQKPPYEPGRFDALIFDLRSMENPTKSREIGVAYTEKSYNIGFEDRFVIDGEMYFQAGWGMENHLNVIALKKSS